MAEALDSCVPATANLQGRLPCRQWRGSGTLEELKQRVSSNRTRCTGWPGTIETDHVEDVLAYIDAEDRSVTGAIAVVMMLSLLSDQNPSWAGDAGRTIPLALRPGSSASSSTRRGVI